MKRKFYLLSLLITILVTACQGMFPSQVSIPIVGISYILESNPLASTEYRALDGSGNNISNPTWGGINQQLLRIAPMEYADGISSPAGADRPSARVISNTFSVSPEDGILNDRDFTAFVYAWGQFLDHDIDLTGSAKPKESFAVIVPTGDMWFDPNSTGSMTILCRVLFMI